MSDAGDLTTFTVGDWHVDPVLKQITRADEIVRIDPRNMRVLVLLATRAGAVVSQREIEEFAWNGLVVTPNSVYQSVAQLRRALGENKSSRRYIETVSRRGYRLLAPVTFDPPRLRPDGSDERIATIEPSQPVSIGRTRRLSPRLALVVGAIAVVTVAAFLSLRGPLRDVSPATEQSRGTERTVDAAEAETAPAAAPSIDADARPQLPATYQGDSSYRKAIAYYEKYVASQSDAVGADDPSLLPILINLANIYPLISEPLKCEQAARRGLEILEKDGRAVSSEGVELNATLAEAFADTHRFAEADEYLTHALELARRVHGDGHYAIVGVIDQFALLRLAEERFEEAEREARRAVAAYRNVRDATGVREAYLRSTLTWALVEQRRYEDAVNEGTLAVKAIRTGEPPAPYLAAIAHHFLGEALVKAGRYEDAESALRTELDLLSKIPHVAMDGARAESGLAEALMKRGKFDEAAKLLQKATLTLKTGDGWRERKSRRETQVRFEQLQLARAKGPASGQLAATPTR